MRPLLPQPIAALVLFASLTFSNIRPEAANENVKEQPLQAPLGVTIKVRMEGPYTADTPLQVVCYFKYSPEGARRMSGAPVELDKRLAAGSGRSASAAISWVSNWKRSSSRLPKDRSMPRRCSSSDSETRAPCRSI